MKMNKDIAFVLGMIVIAICFGIYMRNGITKGLRKIKVKYNLPALGAAFFNSRSTDVFVVGVRKYGDPTKARRGDKFHIGSCTKTMTAALFATFVEEGVIDFETELKDIFPEIQMRKEFEDVTMGMLLTHHSGVVGDLDLQTRIEIVNSSNNIIEQRKYAAKKILQIRPVAFPGLEFYYSNNGYILLGSILEKISNKSWEELIQERIFKPLGMSDSGFGAPGKNTEEVLQPWPHYEKHSTPSPIDPNGFSDNFPFYGPAATVHCSLRDWTAFLKEQIKGYRGRGTLLKTGTYDTLCEGCIGEYVLGGWIIADKETLIHNGSNTFNYAVASINPRKCIGYVAVTNFAGADLKVGVQAVKEALQVIKNHHYK